VVGVISRFTALKGVQYIIPAFKNILQNYPNALLMFFGGQGDYEKELNELLAQIPRESYFKVEFENDLSAVYPLFDVFVQVSIDRTIESFGQTYVEALAAGIPSVFTLSGIASDFIKDRENALVVPYQDENAIYRAVSELLADRSLAGNISVNGRESIKEHFDLPVMIRKLEQLYEQG
jgi:glycosyltransferase involved in cell wall biosynthesis